MSEIRGENILEVWDYRLSTAVPLIDRRDGTWVVAVYAKNNNTGEPVESYNTGIESVDGDEYDREKVTVCYEWLLTVRDRYSLPDIEGLKPLASRANQLQAELSEIQRGMSAIDAAGSHDVRSKISEMDSFKMGGVR